MSRYTTKTVTYASITIPDSGALAFSSMGGITAEEARRIAFSSIVTYNSMSPKVPFALFARGVFGAPGTVINGLQVIHVMTGS